MADTQPGQRDEMVPFLLRLTTEERERLRHDAREAGLSMQKYCQLRLLGAVRPERPTGRPRKHAQREELPLGRSA